MMKVPYFLINTFRREDHPVSGNRAGVCWTGPKELTVQQMQAIASEVQLSNTAFLACSDGDYSTNSEFKLRWFTPKTEINLSGQGTLAVAHSVFLLAKNENKRLTFHTSGGVIEAYKKTGSLVLRFEQPKLDHAPNSDLRAVLQALFSSLVRNTQIAEMKVSRKFKKLIICMTDEFTEEHLTELKPDFHRMLTAHDGKLYTGVAITTKSSANQDYHFYSRYFSPWEGVNEDPVCATAHTVLGPFWANNLNKTKLIAKSCSKRSGELRINVRQNAVELEGSANVIIEGQMAVPEKRE